MPKILYLTKDDKGHKLRRRVPADLRAIVGKTEWVERVSPKPWSQLKEQAALFASSTNAKLRKARADLNRASTPAPKVNPGAPGFKTRPSRQDVEQIALAYFLERERAQRARGDYLVPAKEDDHRDAMEVAGVVLRDALLALEGKAWDPREDRSNYYQQDALTLLDRYDYLDTVGVDAHGQRAADPSVTNDPSFRALMELIGRAEAELAFRRHEALRTEREQPVSDAFFAPMLLAGADPKPASVGKSHTVSELVTSFLDRKSREVGSSRLSQFNVPTRALLEEVGPSAYVSDISRSHCQDIADLFVRVPSYAAQHHRGLSLRDASEAHNRRYGSYPSRFEEANKSLAALKMVLSWAIDLGWIEANPADRVTIAEPARTRKKSAEAERGYAPFSRDELQAIFSAPLFTGSVDDDFGFARPGPTVHKRARYWAPLIALWTGMRLNEILQLERGDLREEDGVTFFDINDREELPYDPKLFEKRLKTQNSVRQVPVHEELIHLGFVKWVVDRPAGRLFPEATGMNVERPSIVFSKRFNTFLKSRQVWVPRRKVFHSFRNNFNDALRSGGVERELREAINGWTTKSMDAEYGSGHSLRTLRDAVNKAAYPLLDLSHIVEAGRHRQREHE